MQILSYDPDKNVTNRSGRVERDLKGPYQIPGVPFTHGWVRQMDQSATRLAGSIGMEDTGSLWDMLLSNESTRPVIEKSFKDRADDYGWVPTTAFQPKHRTVKMNHLIACFNKPALKAIVHGPNQFSLFPLQVVKTGLRSDHAIPSPG